MNPCCNQGALTLWQPDQTPVPFCMMWNGLGLYHLLCDHAHFLCRREPLVRRLCCHSKNCGAAGETPPGNRGEGAQWYTPLFANHWNLYATYTFLTFWFPWCYIILTVKVSVCMQMLTWMCVPHWVIGQEAIDHDCCMDFYMLTGSHDFFANETNTMETE